MNPTGAPSPKISGPIPTRAIREGGVSGSFAGQQLREAGIQDEDLHRLVLGILETTLKNMAEIVGSVDLAPDRLSKVAAQAYVEAFRHGSGLQAPSQGPQNAAPVEDQATRDRREWKEAFTRGQELAVREIFTRICDKPEEDFLQVLRWLGEQGGIARKKYLVGGPSPIAIAHADGFNQKIATLAAAGLTGQVVELPLVPGSRGIPEVDRERFEVLGLAGTKEAVWKRELELEKEGWGFFASLSRPNRPVSVHHFLRHRVDVGPVAAEQRRSA